MKLKMLWIAATLIAMPSAVFAHSPKGANGGVQADAGNYHVEVVPKGTILLVFLRDHTDKDVKSEGFKGTAIFVVGGKSHRILLTPAGENRLSGTASVDLPAEPKGAVQITTPTGSTVQAKFEPPRVCRRLQLLRRWSHEQSDKQQVFA